jgi:hypothetical protein
MWQEIIVGICVLGALVFLVRRWLPVGRKKSAACGSGCGGCASTGSTSCSIPTSAGPDTHSNTNGTDQTGDDLGNRSP